MSDHVPIFQHSWTGDEQLYEELTDKQWKILKAALTVFTEKGYSASTTSEIARVAGVAEGTIFRHFKTKKEILLATLIPLMQNFIGPGAANSLHDLVLQYDNLPIEDVLMLVIEDRQKHITALWPVLRIVIIEANFHPELRDVLLNNVVKKVQESFLAFLKQRQSKGELRDDLDVWTMMRTIVGAAAAYFVSRSLFPEREQDHDNRQELKAIVDLFLRGAQVDVRY
ncbi:TetR/AcrR family transcriptional regulator [Desulfosporosinus sp. OT]|uniref:TetR/AcrR family transcriptional regulator n=1 Tax=Desulfosporosinus sp. OT TaxID=913865 RepID=UPI0002239BC0|nr:TetR/AcrR family transcriptional regulator [Desulfosporosinus sp. OT]EGW37424.1 bacterial regulatory s, tetR family protein [Desulfosporosinus sp. OT]